MATKIYYPRCIDNERFEDNPKRQEFYDTLKRIRAEAVDTKGEWGAFYYEVIFTMPDGKKFRYLEDADYGIPSSLEEI